MEAKNLKNGWSAAGSNKNDLRKVLAELEAATHYVVVNPEALTLFSRERHTNGKYYTVTLSKDTVKNGFLGVAKEFTTNAKTISENCEDIDSDLLSESMAAGAMVYVPFDESGNKIIYTSEEGMRALAFMTGLSMDDSKAEKGTDQNVFRDALIMNRLNKPVTLVIRAAEGKNGVQCRKLFGVLSEKYTPVSLETITDLIDAYEADDAFGKGELKTWSTDHFFSSAIVEFPELANEFSLTYGLTEDIVPGVRISTSCTGQSAYRVQSVFRMDTSSSYMVTGEMARKHTGEIKPDELITEAKNKLFADVTEIPKALSEKMTKFIYDGDVATERGRKKNKAAVSAAYRRGVRKLHVKKAIGDKRTNTLLTTLEAEILDGEKYTEFDIAANLMTIGDRIANLPAYVKNKLEKAVADAPFVTYASKNDEDMIIRPDDDADDGGDE